MYVAVLSSVHLLYCLLWLSVVAAGVCQHLCFCCEIDTAATSTASPVTHAHGFQLQLGLRLSSYNALSHQHRLHYLYVPHDASYSS